MVSLPEAGGFADPTRGVVRLPFLKTTKDYLLGIALLVVVVSLWTISNYVTQGLFVNGYHKPFFVTYLNTSSFSLYLLPYIFRYWWGRWKGSRGKSLDQRGVYEVIPADSEHIVADSNTSVFTQGLSRTSNVPTLDIPLSSEAEGSGATELPPLTTKEVANLALAFCLLWFIANWAINASLDYTSVASSTVLTSTSGFFTLIVGRLFGVEALSPVKILAVTTSFVGVLLVSLSDNSSPTPSNPSLSLRNTIPPINPYTNPFLGDSLALSAAVCYAFYVIILKVRIRSESRIDMQLFFGFVGAFNIIALSPVGLILHLTGAEPFQLPFTGKEWGAVVINMLITLSSDYLHVIAMLKTTPVVATIGLSLTIPLAFIGDKILNIPTRGQAAVGALLVLGSFGIVGWQNALTAGKEEPQPGAVGIVSSARGDAEFE